MHFNPYGGSAAQVAAGLVNLGHAPAAELVAMMRSHGMSLRRLSAADAAAVADWGDRLRPVFAESDVDKRVDVVNELLADSACRPFISRHDGLAAHLHYASEESGAVRRLQAYTAGGLAHLLCEEPERLGTCDRPGCGTVYVDTSRNGRRRYCTTKCATRVYVAEHRDRRRAG
ncbi:CGNR zinc finger domain-containing protein [Amycolatopsis magusensis]|uniref:RNA-binding Zn ribbon-like protein n=1 Tax=Amycolatopsis magusensis TaxID=882444 RepID=A0ABS4PYH6_9PSEU|nr:CGNR zinc finger domain-containing protein [Amycolatopsis magusensis]MBP2183950.1 putative RNA-binding Zn ribbon-like protein [Amycolatopsis magusensis]MDI5979748.1 CGNR zinc finger domain-containing protein [Amycolatopsis magusensis]